MTDQPRSNSSGSDRSCVPLTARVPGCTLLCVETDLGGGFTLRVVLRNDYSAALIIAPLEPDRGASQANSIDGNAAH